ncbi:hypothetical protein SAMN04488527_10871 [Aliiroseovarius crassostreae]|nr:hypothetical protein SAMN04488527_10871 [Aliiroseovarius crassostreae]
MPRLWRGNAFGESIWSKKKTKAHAEGDASPTGKKKGGRGLRPLLISVAVEGVAYTPAATIASARIGTVSALRPAMLRRESPTM